MMDCYIENFFDRYKYRLISLCGVKYYVIKWNCGYMLNFIWLNVGCEILWDVICEYYFDIINLFFVWLKFEWLFLCDILIFIMWFFDFKYENLFIIYGF